jgi:hypothetical protein
VSGNSAEISRLERADSLGLAFFRTAVLLNGGGFLALLTFLGNASNEAAIVIVLSSIKRALACFLVGIVSVLSALVVSYSYTASAPTTSWHKFWKRWIISLNSVVAIIAIAAFASAVIALINGASSA